MSTDHLVAVVGSAVFGSMLATLLAIAVYSRIVRRRGRHRKEN